MKILETCQIENKTHVKITFEMKDSLKKAIPSAKYHGDTKTWSVGSRSIKKLEEWVKKATEEFDLNAIEQKEKAFAEKLEQSKMLTGHTYDFKDELKEKFNAFFSKNAWYVRNEVSKEAQIWLDEKNDARRKLLVCEDDLSYAHNSRSAYEKLQLLYKIIDNFEKNDNEEYAYKYQDDYFYQTYLKYSNLNKEFGLIREIATTLGNYLTSSNEDTNPGIFFEKKYQDWCRIFNIPLFFIINFVEKQTFDIIDFKSVEKDFINKMFKNNQYKTCDVKDAVKEVFGEKRPPHVMIHSKKTGVFIDILDNPLIDLKIEYYQSSSNVRHADVLNVPILLDENYETIIKGYRNGRSRTYTRNILND